MIKVAKELTKAIIQKKYNDELNLIKNKSIEHRICYRCGSRLGSPPILYITFGVMILILGLLFVKIKPITELGFAFLCLMVVFTVFIITGSIKVDYCSKCKMRV